MSVEAVEEKVRPGRRRRIEGWKSSGPPSRVACLRVLRAGQSATLTAHREQIAAGRSNGKTAKQTRRVSANLARPAERARQGIPPEVGKIAACAVSRK